MFFFFFTAPSLSLSLFLSLSLGHVLIEQTKASDLSSLRVEDVGRVETDFLCHANITPLLSCLSFSIFPSSPPLPSFPSHLNQNSFRRLSVCACGLVISADLVHMVWRDVTAVCYSDRKCDLSNRKFLPAECNLERGRQLP